MPTVFDARVRVEPVSPSCIHLHFTGPDLSGLYQEAGGHRFQRVPPSERRGRVHTSTVTVAILEAAQQASIEYPDHEFEYQPFKASGPGGQHRNKTSSAIRCVHRPTGLVQVRTGKCQHRNRKEARAALEQLLRDHSVEQHQGAQNRSRQAQVGSGMRGDKRRSYRLPSDTVSDDVTGKRCSWKTLQKTGAFDRLWH